MEINRTTLIVIIVLAVLLFGGIGYAWMNNKSGPDPNYTPVTMPGQYANPQGYPGTGSYPGSSGYPSSGTDSTNPPGPGGAEKKPDAGGGGQ